MDPKSHLSSVKVAISLLWAKVLYKVTIIWLQLFEGKKQCLEKCFSARGNFVPLPLLRDIDNVWRLGRCFWHLVKCMPEMQLNILQCARQPPKQRLIWPHKSVAPSWEVWCRVKTLIQGFVQRNVTGAMPLANIPAPAIFLGKWYHNGHSKELCTMLAKIPWED